MRILYLSAWNPYPANNGSKLRVYNLLRGLAQQHTVSLITFGRDPRVKPAAELSTLCERVHIVPRHEYNPLSARAVMGFLSSAPRVIVATHSPSMTEQIQRELERVQFDLVIASQWITAAYWPAFGERPSLFEEVELGLFETKKMQARFLLPRLRYELTLTKLRRYLRHLLPNFHSCTVVSEIEAQKLRSAAPEYRAIEVIPNCIDTSRYAGVEEKPRPYTLIFTGSLTFFSNHDAMAWFLSEVFPQILSRMPRSTLTITGDHGGLPLPQSDNVTLTGLVDDVRPLVASSWVSVAPMRLAGGTRLKILEAMALRTPVVATSKGAEGLHARHGEHLLIADTAEDFAEALVRLLDDPGLRQRLTSSAYALVRERYDWKAVTPQFLDLVEKAAFA